METHPNTNPSTVKAESVEAGLELLLSAQREAPWSLGAFLPGPWVFFLGVSVLFVSSAYPQKGRIPRLQVKVASGRSG